MPEDPIGMLVSNLANVFNMTAPHVVIPKMIASLTPKAPPAEAAMKGAGYDGGVLERRAARENGVEAMQQRFTADREATQKSGYSMTGKTTFF